MTAGRVAFGRGAPVLGYLVVALAFTGPVWAHPATRWVGGPSDPMKFMEFLGWYPFSITHGLDPLLNTYVNLPHGSNMMWDTTLPLLGLVAWPVTATFGVVAAYNVSVLVALVLDGWCTYIWLARHVRHRWAAWLGGLLLVLGPFTAARAHEHLNLLMFFPAPLVLVEVEKWAAGERRRPGAAGARAGLLLAVQFLLCEEVVALLAVTLVTAAVIAVVMRPAALARAWRGQGAVRARREREALWATLRATALAGGTALVTCGVIVAVPLAYQLYGPGRIHGALEPSDYFVTDLLNFFVPTSYTALAPHSAVSLSLHWTGNLIEDDAYIGLPLLAVALGTLVYRWREAWPRLVGLTTLAVAVWSLGPHLHVDGRVAQFAHLPARLFESLPLLDNLLPARFALFMDFGLAALLALFADRAFTGPGWRRRAGAGALLALVCATLAPAAPVPAYSPVTPRYFAPGGDAQRLAQGTVALVVPFGDSEATMAPMFWQARSGFRLKMVSGAMFTAGRGGAASLGETATGSPLDCVMQVLQMGLPENECPAGSVAASRAQLHRLGVEVIILGPLGYGRHPPPGTALRKFLSAVAGQPPRRDEGVLVWPF